MAWKCRHFWGSPVTEYIGEAKVVRDFKEPYDIQDGPLPSPVETNATTFGFNDLQLEPRAWIDNWIVRTDSFELIIN